jgi:hypothetical protein
MALAGVSGVREQRGRATKTTEHENEDDDEDDYEADGEERASFVCCH